MRGLFFFFPFPRVSPPRARVPFAAEASPPFYPSLRGLLLFLTEAKCFLANALLGWQALRIPVVSFFLC